MRRPILTCINCGGPVVSLGRTGTTFSTMCPACGISSHSIVEFNMNSERRSRDIEIVRYSKEERRTVSSEYP